MEFDESQHSWRTSVRSYEDFFDDLGLNESVDSNKLNKAKLKMLKDNHPDKHKANVKKGYDRHTDLNYYETKTQNI